MPAKLTQEEFIRRANKIHGNKYDYSKCNYINFYTKVIVICKKHGEFLQRPVDGHLKGQGCPRCAMGKIAKQNTKTTIYFLKKAHVIHGNKYDYSLVSYKKSHEKVKIICLKCRKIFLQTANNHINSRQGCPECAGNMTSNTKSFIEKAKKIHKSKYDYQLTSYKSVHSKITILCPFHGAFKQEANSHLRGRGCPKCSIYKPSNTKSFIEKAKKIHKNKYNYRLTSYKNSKSKITISCPVHGIFKQTPNSHLKGKGCSKCRNCVSKMERQWLDAVGVPDRPNTRQVTLKINGKNYLIDGYVPNTKTIYEFYGDYWHGNPRVFNCSEMNKTRHKLYGELYNETMNRERDLKKGGYNLITIWESDFKKQQCIKDSSGAIV